MSLKRQSTPRIISALFVVILVLHGLFSGLFAMITTVLVVSTVMFGPPAERVAVAA